MQTFMLISFIADDRPGLVQGISEAVARLIYNHFHESSGD